MTPRAIAIASVCLLAGYGCSTFDSTSPDDSDVKQSQRPRLVQDNDVQLSFRAEYPTTFVFGSLPGQIFVQGNGVSNILGSSTIFAEEFLNPFVFPNTLTGVALVFTASTGDQLIGHFDGFVEPPTPLPPAPPPAVVIFEGTFTITGGTGRFENATGAGRFRGNAIPTAGTGFAAWKGVINLPE